MQFSKIKESVFALSQVASKHSPEILIGVGIAGFITAICTTAVVAPKAAKKVEVKKSETEDGKITPLEVLQCTWKEYLPVVLITLTSTVCVIQSKHIDAKRLSALGTLYQIAESKLVKKDEIIKDYLGDKKINDFKSFEANKAIDNNEKVNKMIIVEKDKPKIYIEYTGDVLVGDRAQVEKGINEFNRRMVCGFDYGMSLNDLWDILGLPQAKIGDEVGWNPGKGLVEVRWSAFLRDDIPMQQMEFVNPPYYDFR